MVVMDTQASGGIYDKENDEVFDVKTTPILSKCDIKVMWGKGYSIFSVLLNTQCMCKLRDMPQKNDIVLVHLYRT